MYTETVNKSQYAVRIRLGFGGNCGVQSAECGKCGVWKMRGTFIMHASRPFLSILSFPVLSSSSPFRHNTEITITVCGKTFLFYMYHISEPEQLLQLETINLYDAIPMKYHDILHSIYNILLVFPLVKPKH